MSKTNDQMDRSFLEADIKELLGKMSVDEKIGMLAGNDWWNTVPVPRLNIPSVKVSDGPNGARGESFYHMCPATILPNATCIGATFSPKLATSVGSLLASESKARNATCLLAPTINIQRSPLGGRAFESFSEDPTHSGLVAAAYVNGLQENGVSATIKHFVANDQEHERMGEDSIMSQRTLREVYLRPFQIAQKRAKPWAYMTSYNKLNGTHCSENDFLLQQVLRKEWKHDGLVMSDWYGTYSVSESINAGLDLEMPGSAKWHDKTLVGHLLNAHKIDMRTIDRNAGSVLRWVQKLAKANEELVYAKPSKERTRTEDQEEDAKLVRRVGAEGIVLLKNQESILPIQNEKQKIAIIGPNAKAKVLTGGGSALLRAAWSVSPWEGLLANKPESVELEYNPWGGHVQIPTNPRRGIAHHAIDTETDAPASKPVVTDIRDNSDMLLADFYHPDLGKHYFSEVTSVFKPTTDGEWEFGVTVTGQAWLWIDDEFVVDNSRKQERGSSFFGNGTIEKKGTTKVVKGKTYKLRLLHDSRLPPDADLSQNTPFAIVGIRLGAFPVFHPDQAISDSATLAKSSQIAIIVAGLNADWESEGYDRPNLSLPLRTNDLIHAVADANPNTIVIIQAGSAVSMPWIDKVKAVVYAWYGGNECGNAIADIVYGKVNPSGRLPVTFPKREEDIAAALNYKSARTKIYYDEGIWVGYKHHNARSIPPLFPFGHGLSYTSFEYSDLTITSPPPTTDKADEWKIKVKVTVTNSGKIAGSHSVHFYTCPPTETATGLKHPQWALQAFEKVYDLQPGKSEVVEVELEKYAISHWDEVYKTFRAEQGEWKVKVGVDSQSMYGAAAFEVKEDLEWSGL